MNRRGIVIMLTLATLALAGCESKQAKVQRLETEYDKLNTQYRNDCLGMGWLECRGSKRRPNGNTLKRIDISGNDAATAG